MSLKDCSMSNKKTVYFHIGTHKTGTTALQKFFVDNREVLKNNCIDYDNYHPIEMNQGFLIREEAWSNINFDASRNHLISSEDFYHYILQISNCVSKALLDFDIHFIVYFKRQDLMKESVYNQIVKMAGFCGEIEDDNHYNLDYYSFLLNLKDRYPESKITVRPYEKEQFFNGTIQSDFLNILGLKLGEEWLFEKSVVNPSLARDKLEFCRIINCLELPSEMRQKINRLVVKAAVNANEVSLFRKQNILSPKQSTDILNKYVEGNKRIAQEFLNRDGGDLFYNEIENDDNWKVYPGLSNEAIKKILIEAQAIDGDLIDYLYNHIATSQIGNIAFCSAANILMPIIEDVYGRPGSTFFIEPSQNFSVNDFKYLRSKITEASESADILREVSFAFARKGDIKTAFNVMQEAYNLRPEGPVIKQKLNEYKDHLQSEEDK